MHGTVVIGAQWGDEGKGKLVDVFSAHSDIVVRYQGGANAGHTLVVDNKKTVLHLIPSGVLHPNTTCLITAGVVVDIFSLLEEIEKLQTAGYLKDPKQLMISDNATVLLPYHKVLDALRETSLSKDKIGTTGKGIGPAYEDRSARRAILFGDLFHKERLKQKLELALTEKNFLLKNFYKAEEFKVDDLVAQIGVAAEKLSIYRMKDSSLYLNKALKSGKKVLFEGAQGSMLDIHHGTYPFVTSSSTLSGSACIAAGIGPMSIQKVIGVFKAYTTRVGSGPFPTELNDEVGERIRKEGHEFGATTGRPRRCGWLDLVALKYAIRLNGVSNLAMMKLDILKGHEKLAVCTGYKLDGDVITEWPMDIDSLDRVEPILEWLPGWSEDISQLKALNELPRNATKYIDFIANQLGTPIDIISVGPGREQTLWVKPLFNG
ncbi:MAG TPA: adenylosuccinate synthase [Pseudobdellovibrionaceae bacterium]|nr:adenylosuccinate synthase [Pseudobdellovibrionaceae bacterium]